MLVMYFSLLNELKHNKKKIIFKPAALGPKTDYVFVYGIYILKALFRVRDKCAIYM